MQIVTICQVKQQLSLLCLFALWLISCTGYHSGRTGVPVPDSSGIASHSDPAVKRYGMVTGLRTDKVAYYEQLHANVWPGVLKTIKSCNIRNYSIYLNKIGNDYFLFSYFEYTGNDFDADMKKMAQDSLTQQWWKETAPAQRPLPEAAAHNQVWTPMEEVFHQN